jgi:DNA topoisomerase-3
MPPRPSTPRRSTTPSSGPKTPVAKTPATKAPASKSGPLKSERARSASREAPGVGTVILAEKPSQARAYAIALRGTPLAGATIVAARGHLLRLEEPRDRGLTSWHDDEAWPDLTLTPRLHPASADARKHLAEIRRAVTTADTVIIATDPDREGEAIAWTILEYLDARPARIARMVCAETNPGPLRAAFGTLHAADVHRPKAVAAHARARIDLITGTNLTVAATIALDTGTRQGPLTIGRVKTPTLRLVVNRDRAIENFVARDHFALRLRVQDPGTHEELALVHSPDPHIESHALANALADKAHKAGPSRLSLTCERQKTPPPQLFDKPTLLRSAARSLGWKPDVTSAVLQELYEGGWVTYPRSDCRVIGAAHAQATPVTLATIAKAVSDLQDEATHLAANGPLLRPKRVVDDTAVARAAHTAIVPTANGGRGSVAQRPRALYSLIARRYIAALSPDAEHDVVTAAVALTLDEDRAFKARDRRLVRAGWLAIEPVQEERPDDRISDVFTDALSVHHAGCTPVARRTEPPRRYTFSTLLAAMQAAHQHVEDKQLAVVLRDITGLGTAATIDSFPAELIRAGLIEERKPKPGAKAAREAQLVSTSTGRALIDALTGCAPDITLPDLTGRVEIELRRLEQLPLDEARTGADRLVAAYAARVRAWFAAIKANAIRRASPPGGTAPARAAKARARHRGRRSSR